MDDDKDKTLLLLLAGPTIRRVQPAVAEDDEQEERLKATVEAVAKRNMSLLDRWYLYGQKRCLSEYTPQTSVLALLVLSVASSLPRQREHREKQTKILKRSGRKTETHQSPINTINTINNAQCRWVLGKEEGQGEERRALCSQLKLDITTTFFMSVRVGRSPQTSMR